LRLKTGLKFNDSVRKRTEHFFIVNTVELYLSVLHFSLTTEKFQCSMFPSSYYGVGVGFVVFGLNLKLLLLVEFLKG
jgi:hypothetical protein